jgi:hypothetical protein
MALLSLSISLQSATVATEQVPVALAIVTCYMWVYCSCDCKCMMMMIMTAAAYSNTWHFSLLELRPSQRRSRGFGQKFNRCIQMFMCVKLTKMVVLLLP